DQQDRLAVGQTLDECLSRLGRWGLASYQFFDYVNALVTSTVRQSTEESSLDHLLRGALCVVAWLRAVNSAATGVMRCADGALACPTSTLLAERLTATAAHFPTGLGRVVVLTNSSKLSVDDLVHQIDGHPGVKGFGRQLDRAIGFTF